MEKRALANSSFCRNILIISVVNTGFSLGYAFTSLNPLVPVLQNLYNSTYQNRYDENISETDWITLLSLTMSLVIAGGFCGSVTLTYVLKIFSRRQAMIFWNVIVIVGAVFVSAIAGHTGSHEAFIIGRFVMGYGLGLSINLTPIVIAECSTQSVQAKYQSIIGVGISIGSIFGPVISHHKVLGTPDLWPAVVAFNCLLPVTYICLSPWIPETPYSLLRQNKRGEAIKVVRKMRVGSEVAIMAEIAAMEKEQIGFETDVETSEKHQEKIKYVDTMGVLRNPQYRRQLFVVSMLFCGLASNGINHAMLFSDQIFIKGGIAADVVTYATIGVFCAQGLAAFAGMWIISAVGSRKLLIWSVSATAVSNVIITTSLATQHLSESAGYISIVGVLLLLVSNAVGPNVAAFAVVGELTIEPTRQMVLHFGGGVLWFTAWLTGFIPPYLEAAMGPYAFLVWCGASIACVVFIYFFIPETTGKNSEEIQRALMEKA